MRDPSSVTPPGGGPLEGRTLGDYVVRELLGEGGMGAVYRAEQPALERQVVLKVLSTQSQASPVMVQRFLREARLASSLDHPFAAHVYDFGVEPDGVWWIAMELVRGTPLDKLLSTQGKMPLPRLVPLFERLCEVVHAAHEQGIIHRDLKPANVMVISHAGRYSPKLLDLGIAKLRQDLAVEARAGKLTGELTLAPTDDPAPTGTDRHAQTVALSPPDTKAPTAEISRVPTQAETFSRAVSMDLTDHSYLVGTPYYLAPELWVDPRAASPQSDIYALGVLAFRALNGTTPFKGEDTRAIARAHRGPIPDLGPDFSSAVKRVIDRALARVAADRYATALEFAQALREAAGMAVELDALPHLDDELRERLLTDAPSPLAEAVSAIDVARSSKELAKAVSSVAGVLAWWLGIVALAARLRVGPGGAIEEPRTVELLGRLRAAGLGPEGWLALARALVEPFGPARDAHPVPELVALFAPGGAGDALSAELPVLAAFDDAAAEPSPSEVAARLARLARSLSAVQFLCDYTLVVEKNGSLEIWSGVRRRQRATVRSLSALEPGEVGLSTEGGALALSLSPLVQHYPPAPGAPTELFLLAGPGRLGARLSAPPLAFERHDPQLWEQLAAEGLSLGDAGAASDASDRSPFLGLSSFTVADSANFFGREREAQACANRLREQPLLAVVGPSGAGKSSFVQAGVVPLLPPGWRSIFVRPGSAPLAGLESRLGQLGMPAHGLAEKLRREPGALAALLKAEARRGGGVLLFVDQFEELVTLCGDPAERERYAEALALAATSAADPVRVTLAMRDDFLIRVKQLEALRERLTPSLELLTTPSRADLLRILVEPARRAGLSFEDEALPEEMVAAVADQPGALALLSFTALKLWEVRDRRLHAFTRKAYRALGGVGGALAQHAEATLDRLKEGERPLAREAFRHLVTSQGTRAVLRRSEMEQLLGKGPLAQSVLEELIAGRLLVTSEGAEGEDRIEVIHETLLSSWPRLVQWQREDAEGARLRDQLREAARQWEARGRPRGVLWRGDVLTEYRLWRARYPGALTQSEEAFAASSLSVDARATRLWRGSLALAFVVLSIGLAVVFQMMRQARETLLRTWVEQGRQALTGDEPLRGLAYLIHAKKEGARGPTLDLLLARGARRLEGQERVFYASRDPLWVAQLSPDEGRVLTAGLDGVSRVWDARSGALIATLDRHSVDLHRAFFSPDGERVATASSDRTAGVWSARTGHRLLTLAHPERVPTVQFSPDGGAVVTACRDGVARLWSATSGELLRSFGAPGSGLAFAWLSPDGERLVTGGNDGLGRVWETQTGQLLGELRGHAGPLRRGVFSHDGKSLLTLSEDRAAIVWDVRDRSVRVRFTEHTMSPMGLAFSADDAWIATGGEDGALEVWSAATGAVRLSRKLAGPVLSVAFAPDGRRLLAATQTGELETWDLETGARLWSYLGQVDGIYGALFSSDGTRILTAGLDGTARLWDARLSSRRLSLGGLGPKGSPATFAALAPGGEDLYGAAGDYVVARWSSRTGALVARWDPLRAADYDRLRNGFAQPSPDRHLLAVVKDRSAQLRDAGTFALVRELTGHEGRLSYIDWSPGGDRVVTASADRHASVWEAASGRRLQNLAHDGAVSSATFDRRGERVVTASQDHRVRVWDAASGRLLAKLDHPLPVEHAAFSADGARVVTSCQDKTARVWDWASGKLLASMEGHVAHLTHAEFNPEGTAVATASEDGTARVWDAGSGALLEIAATHAGEVSWVTWTADGQELITAGADGQVRTWPMGTRAPSDGQLEAISRCRLPYEVRGEQVVLARERPRCD